MNITFATEFTEITEGGVMWGFSLWTLCALWQD